MSSSEDKGRRPVVQVLVADDDAHARNIVTMILEGMGCRVDAVANGAEAVEAADKLRSDLIYLDGVMPEMDGIEAARAIRQLPGERGRVPIVGITGATTTITEEKCRQAGMNDYLEKPIGRDDYRDAVRRWALGEDKPPPDESD